MLPKGHIFNCRFNIAVNLGGEANFAWLIPISGIVVIAITYYEHSTNTNEFGKITSILAGALPFIGLFRGLFQAGKDLFEVLAIGVYSSLIIGLVLLLSGFGVLNSFFRQN